MTFSLAYPQARSGHRKREPRPRRQLRRPVTVRSSVAPENPTVRLLGSKDFRPCDHDERRFAEILTHYGIGYRYESKEFVLAIDPETRQQRRGFTPDFYLPGFNIYIELTQGKDKNKRGKIRQVERGHGVRVMLLAGRDLRAVLSDPKLLPIMLADFVNS